MGITTGHAQKTLDKDSFFDIHMMVSRTDQQVKTTAMAETNEYAFHLEMTEKPGTFIKVTQENWMEFGLTLNQELQQNIWDHKLISGAWPCGTWVWRAEIYGCNDLKNSLVVDTFPLFGHRDK